MEQVLNELYNKYPELKTNPRLTDIAEKFRNIVFNQIDNSSPEPSIRANSIKAEDPIRKLLSNVINYIEPRPASGTKKESTANVPKTVYNTPSKSGFDYNEALHPTENLQEILKAFNLDNKNSQNK